jgi:5-methyltetrahydropteroyltriglutamate--homocysteine methyltransferase
MVKTYAYGFPRIGKNREFKKSIEKYWKDGDDNLLSNSLFELQKEIINTYESNGIDNYPQNEMTGYDKMFDTAIMVGAYNPKDTEEYYDMCRGANALEMTKWFNTNYHYLVPEISDDTEFKLDWNGEYSKWYTKPLYLIGPYTFLKLSKGSFDFESKLEELTNIYLELLNSKKDFYNSFHIDEPAFVMDTSDKEIEMIKKIYNRLSEASVDINLFTYYEDVDWLEELFQLPVNGIGLDFVNGRDNFKNLQKIGFPKDKTLFVGLVDGINVWKTNIKYAVNTLDKLSKWTDNLVVTNAGPLYHLPVTLEGENHLSHFLYKHLSFATEKLQELTDIKNKDYSKYSIYVGQWNNMVEDRVENLKDDDFIKSIDVTERRKLQDEILNLPELPTTTIGSFPQTKDVRLNRLDHKKGRIETSEYNENIRQFIREAVYIQEQIDIDVFVHGESERTDMVEHFCQRMSGMASTENGWIISYGTRVYRPSIIHGDVSREKPMTISEVAYAQSLTDKPMKGMLTGAVTIMAWDFVRKDIPIEKVSYQIALALQDEIRDYERAGIKMVQVDEPAFRELVPIKKKYHKEYFDWAIKSYNLSVNTSPRTQIHCHMCYSEFNEIVEQINQLDFDVVSIECSRSKGEIIEAFEKIDFKRQIGLGVWDIHSPTIPSKDDMVTILKRALRVIPRNQFWINPDCGLKTRGWKETKESMKNMVQAREEILNG